jgi:anti-anti-sigma regulatory factor
MVQVPVARRWELDVERGPDWLFVRPRGSEDWTGRESELAEHLWSLLEQNLTHRLVLELDAIDRLTSGLIERLVSLQKRIHAHDGTLRISGLSDTNAILLDDSEWSAVLPHFSDREAAVMGYARPRQPR